MSGLYLLAVITILAGFDGFDGFMAQWMGRVPMDHESAKVGAGGTASNGAWWGAA